MVDATNDDETNWLLLTPPIVTYDPLMEIQWILSNNIWYVEEFQLCTAHPT